MQRTFTVSGNILVYRGYELTSYDSSCTCGCGVSQTTWEAYCPVPNSPSVSDQETLEALVESVDQSLGEVK